MYMMMSSAQTRRFEQWAALSVSGMLSFTPS